MIDGCYWACPYELVFCRFDNPMALPWPQLDRAELSGEPQGWTEEGFIYESIEEIRTTDLKTYNELPDAEQDDLMKRWKEIGGNRISRLLRSSDGNKVMLDERIVPIAKPSSKDSAAGDGVNES